MTGADPARPDAAAPARNRAAPAALWMLGVVASFLLMMAAVRELSATMSSFELLSFRSIIGIPVMCLIAWRLGFANVLTPRLGLHAIRNGVHFGGQWCWVIGVTLLPLAHVTALEFTMPMWTAIIAVLVLGEPLRRHRVLAVGTGLAGTLLILRPGLEIVTDAALVVLLGSLLYSVSNVMVKSLTATEPPWVIVFWMQFIQLPLALVPAIFVFDWVWPGWADAPWLLAMGVTAMSAHFCMARAFSLADAAVCIPIDFVRLPLAAFMGWLAYSETVGVWIILGALLIFGGNYYSVWREARPAGSGS